ncbi:CMP/dCMP deaminase [Cavenderia fasciculata]|uniref:CMP/dCMP deaminase n=1 Tax=Cavenderia fasciculata TaxID=261658 RepID=F4PGH9_CACFS|nr:CMP/dCMP deaminase [Cavenderia fasciculata]EGG24813.1 CMP/dCMP deaminase [Cavenderia fasciculata]|eukprot:XP_004362664.1 CMP/dCMP deaminase [Cavenderia fasciculata]
MKFLISLLVLVCMVFVANAGTCPDSPFIDASLVGRGKYKDMAKPPYVKTPKDLNSTELHKHENWMKLALQITKAVNGRFGAVIVNENGTLACTGVNQGKINRINHGEIVAINNCSNLYTKNMFEGWTLYTTGEPCPMCQAAIMWTKFKTVVFGSYVSNMYCERCLNQLPISSAAINSLGYGIGHYTEIIGGVLEKETDKLFPTFCKTPKADPSGIQAVCNNGWSRKCSTTNSAFGAFDPAVQTYHSDSDSD